MKCLTATAYSKTDIMRPSKLEDIGLVFSICMRVMDSGRLRQLGLVHMAIALSMTPSCLHLADRRRRRVSEQKGVVGEIERDVTAR